MRAEGELVPFVRCDLLRVFLIDFQACNDLLANALNVLGFEVRRSQRHPQQLERLRAVLRQCLERERHVIVRGLHAPLNRKNLEPVLKCFGIEVAGAFVERAGHKGRGARLAFGVLGGTALEGELQAENRPRVVFHEPGFDALFAGNLLYFHGIRRNCSQHKERQRRYRCCDRKPHELALEENVHHGVVFNP